MRLFPILWLAILAVGCNSAEPAMPASLIEPDSDLTLSDLKIDDQSARVLVFAEPCQSICRKSDFDLMAVLPNVDAVYILFPETEPITSRRYHHSRIHYKSVDSRTFHRIGASWSGKMMLFEKQVLTSFTTEPLSEGTFAKTL